MQIARPDLLNLMRHAYLIGMNDRAASDLVADDRDEVLNDFIDDFEKDGYMDYNDDLGSHTCPDEGCV